MSFPEDLPDSIDQVRIEPSLSAALMAAALQAGVFDPATLLDVVQDTPLRPEGVKLDRWKWRADGRRADQFAILDEFFGVNRVAAGSPEMFSHSAVVGYRTMLADTLEFGTGLSSRDWNEMRFGLESAILFAVGAPGPVRGEIPPPAGWRPRDPHLRWRSGHQIFFPLIQAIVVGLRCFASAVAAGQHDRAVEAATLATDAMSASARAMQFAADFSPTTYTCEVRPSMTPPGVRQSLSGLMSADHHYLIRCFHELQPMVSGLEAGMRAMFDGFVHAVAGTYAAHVHVCDRFHGDEVVSLRMSQSHSMTASDVLAQMGGARMRMLEHDDD